ncbi:MAG: heme exporter protein CcmD [Pseudomonadota bacterium]
MNWSSVSDFLAMGGYGLYVWGSFGMVAAALIAEVVLLKARRLALARSLVHQDDYHLADHQEVAHEGQN